MTGMKVVILFSLVAGAFLVTGVQGDTLDDLLERLLNEVMRERQDAITYLKKLATMAGASIDQAIVVGKDGMPLTSGDYAPVPLTTQQQASIVSAFTSHRFNSMHSGGITVEGTTYRLSAIPANLDTTITLTSRSGTLNMKRKPFGIVVVHAPKGFMMAAVNALNQ